MRMNWNLTTFLLGFPLFELLHIILLQSNSPLIFTAAFHVSHTQSTASRKTSVSTNNKPSISNSFAMRPSLLQRPSLRASTDTLIASNIQEKEYFPQWRTLPSDDEDNDNVEEEPSNNFPPVSYFMHMSDAIHDETNENIFQNALWSNDAYVSALQQYDAFVSCTDSYIAPYVQDALHTLDHAYRLYGPESVVGSFNGGKDAVVILELIRAAHANYYRTIIKEQREKDPDAHIDIIRPRTIYFNNKLEFPDVLQFVHETVNNYDLDMIAFQEGIGFVGGLEMLVKQNYLNHTGKYIHTRPHAMGFVLGTRAADPNAGKQGAFAPSSSWMPPFMRVNPILEWSYGHVWHFLRLYKLPYCALYDQGYTSLGTVKDTLPCPALKKVNVKTIADDTGTEGTTEIENSEMAEYWPAYMLKDWDMERAGRVKKDKKKKSKESKEKKVVEEDTISRCSTVASLPKDSAPIQNNNSPKTEVPQNVDVDSSSESDESLAGNRGSIQRTVGIIIIGDEILKGMTPDTNTHTAASLLKANGVPLARVAVVSDDQEEIVAEIERMSDLVDVIITSGGVGPTHDDVTIKSVADALGSEMVFNEEMAELLKTKMSNIESVQLEHGLTEAQVKMATLPKCSRLKYLSGIEGDWPVLQCGKWDYNNICTLVHLCV